MNLTKNKWYLVFGILLLVMGIFLVSMAFAAAGRLVLAHWLKLGPMGLMCFIGGVGLLFLPAKNKLK
ncbi:MAG TPA: hypothetical protein VHY30_01215 [Verrucomicrobiae bacterium]|jgi:hypothetical protein|nr:hypothetical protein [Verrucomicrobiae bacterium]